MCLIIFKLKNWTCVLNMLCDFICWTLWWQYKLNNFVLNKTVEPGTVFSLLLQLQQQRCDSTIWVNQIPLGKTYVFLLIKYIYEQSGISCVKTYTHIHILFVEYNDNLSLIKTALLSKKIHFCFLVSVLRPKNSSTQWNTIK